jgi:hypothetical protein
MSIRDGYYTDLALANLLRLGILLMILGLGALIMTGCSGAGDKPQAVGLAVKGSYTPGTADVTRNQVPQGGIDEKSGPTPTTPAK